MLKDSHNTLRFIGVICLAAVVVGPTVWISDLLGVTFTWLPVRAAFVLMLTALFVADAVALVHLVAFSSLTKRQKWSWIHVMMLPFQMFAAFEYLIGGGRRS